MDMLENIKTPALQKADADFDEKNTKEVKINTIIINNSKAGESFKRFDKVIRILTVAPIMAAVLISLIYFFAETKIGLTYYLVSLGFLTVFPILAYPIQKLIPALKAKGRRGQRNLAIIMSVAGYILAIIAAAIFDAPVLVWELYLTYLFSGIGMAVVNKVFKIKASGHSCGAAGPVIFLTYVFGAWAIIGAAVLIPVIVSSIRMKRHTFLQLLGGVVIVAISFMLAIAVGILI